MIDRQQALDLLEQVVDEGGRDFVYPQDENGNCQYVRDGAPSCLVGKALFKAGVKMEDLIRLDEGTADTNGPVAACAMDDVIPGVADYEALYVFNQAQQTQDLGDTWGSALDAARKV